MNLAGYEKYRIRLKILSPLFIGGGEGALLNRSGYIFIENEQKVYVLDDGKWMEYLFRHGWLNDYERQITKKDFSNYNYLRNTKNLKDNKIMEVVKEVASYALNVDNKMEFKTNDINIFIRNASGQPYIPGSSIKGALRTAILSGYLQSRRGIPAKAYKNVQDIITANNGFGKNMIKNLNSEISKLEKSICKYRRNISGEECEFDGMSGISVSDAEPFDHTDLFLERKRDLVKTNGKINGEKGISLYREYIRPGTETEFTITIDKYKLKKELGIEHIQDILDAMDKRWQRLFGSRGFFSAWSGIEKHLPEEILKKQPSGLLVIGGGAGYHSKALVAEIAGENDNANKIAKNIMHSRDPRRKHLSDRPFSPRALKVARFNGKYMLIGICSLKVV